MNGHGQQRAIPFGPLQNNELFSSHWLEHRLPLEPEWAERRDEAGLVFERLRKLWLAEKGRVEHYGGEHALEHAFIQPVFAHLGWKIFYQAFLRGREPDYALFLNDADLDAALQAGRNAARFWEFPRLVADAKAWHVGLDRPLFVNNRREYPPPSKLSGT